jgi:hypothetical protein
MEYPFRIYAYKMVGQFKTERRKEDAPSHGAAKFRAAQLEKLGFRGIQIYEKRVGKVSKTLTGDRVLNTDQQ